MGADAAKAIEGLLASVNKPAEGVAATTIGVVLLLIGATTVFGELQDALDRIWRAPARERSAGWWKLLRARLLSFGMILGIAFLLMVSLVLSAAISALGKWWDGFFGGWETVAQVVNFAIGFVMTAGVFAMIYKIMPRVQVRWHDVWLGAVVTALLFTIGKFLIGLYIGKSGVASGFGAAGSLVVIFVWVYYSAQIFLMGAEFTWVYARTFGSMRTSRRRRRKSVRRPAAPHRGERRRPAAGAAAGAHAPAGRADGATLARRRRRRRRSRWRCATSCRGSCVGSDRRVRTASDAARARRWPGRPRQPSQPRDKRAAYNPLDMGSRIAGRSSSPSSLIFRVPARPGQRTTHAAARPRRGSCPCRTPATRA
jgi:YihY family inner membrane protein